MKTFVMLAIGLAALRLMRRRSASARHWALAVAIACAASVPLLQPLATSWRGARPAPARPPAHGRAHRTSPPHPKTQVAGAAVAILDVTGEQPPSSRFTPQLWWWLGRLQLTGAAIFVLVLIAGLLRLEWLAARAVPVTSARVTAASRSVERALGITRPVRLLQTTRVALPMTWGAIHPIVLLPSGTDGWSDVRLNTVLGHELAHVQRGDWLALMLAELLRAIDWLDPLAWLAARRLRFESELACDDLVLGMGASPPEYAAHLLALVRFARVHHAHPVAAASSMARPNGLERRVEAMLNADLERRPATRRARGIIALPLLASALLVSGYGAAAQSLVSLSGVVYDPQSLGVPRATVSLVDPRTESRREVRSDTTGRFEFVGLPAGEYRLETRVPGFEPTTRTVGVMNRHVEQDVTLRLGSLTETVTLSYSPGSEAAGVGVRATGPADMPRAQACAASSTGGNIKPPMKVRDVHPVYPAKGDAVPEGTVLVDARIGADGTVVSAVAREPVSEDLAQSAVAAVLQWRFTPTLLNCVPVEVGMSVSVRFGRQ